MNVFDLRTQLIRDYSSYIDSFINIRDPRIREHVDDKLNSGLLWPDPLIQINPAFEPGHWVDELVAQGILHPTANSVFRRKSETNPVGERFRFHQHQEDAIRTARSGQNYVLTTGTGSGKSLAYIVPIVDYVLRNGSGHGIKAIIVYPMNALANSQLGELKKFLSLGFPDGRGPVTFERYTGQESDEEKQRIMAHPPDILLTNYVMLELILTRPEERAHLVTAAQGLRFLVLDELHTYRGRQGADVSMLVRRVRTTLNATNLQCIGTSATISSSGDAAQQRQDVADVASKLFGAPVLPENIIGETLRRSTSEIDFTDATRLAALRVRVQSGQSPTTYAELINDPLASWVESNLGLRTDEAGTLRRAQPRSLQGEKGAARQLSEETGLPEDTCLAALVEVLMTGYNVRNPETGFPVFAFRLHQFISRSDTVYTSLEPEESRHITVSGQTFVPGDRSRLLYPMVFCRECGQAYYVVRKHRDRDAGIEEFLPREFEDHADEENSERGYLYLSSDDPWLPENVLERIPEEWLEDTSDGEQRVRYNQRKYLPQSVRLNTSGQIDDHSTTAQYIPGKFRFCLHCGVSYNPRQGSEYAKLTQLSTGGRSTDTTILSLSLIRKLRANADLVQKARKMLSFTDNRQDASLQAGHFNDFIEVTLLRSAVYRAVQHAGASGITHEVLPQRVFESLGLDFGLYAIDPTVRFAQKAETERALREVLGYRVYRDLQRGWRITSPNLEQVGLLQIEYRSLDEVCAAEDVWQNKHPALVTASPETRYQVCKTLLDFMRRELAIRVDYLNSTHQEALKQLSSQRLKAPWAIDENEKLEHASVLFPRPRQQSSDEYGGNVFLSPRGGYGQYLRRGNTFPDYPSTIPTAEVQGMIRQILEALREGGLVQIVMEAQNPGEVNGYQVPADAMIWKAGSGERAFRDPIRVPREPEGGRRANRFFIDFYQQVTSDMHGLEAHEHTAQVPGDVRETREHDFREGRLPILYCSPTMELGVDISELNAVNMRNVPPTPANYAQRSGRAGRSGQPALVFTYCTIGSPHDQYYFKRPSLMVAGSVTPPRIDLTNQELLRSHVHAIWLAEANLKLGRSLKELLDLSGDEPSLDVLDSVHATLHAPTARQHALNRARQVLTSIEAELAETDWYTDSWLEGVLNNIPLSFNQACERWRTLYRAAKGQQKAQQRIIDDVSRSGRDRDQARRLRQEAESQIDLLTDSENVMQSDFYSYRYFASEGFLPGYSFPRLPLSAFIPGRRIRGDKDEFLSRSRFLAISEFGPRSIIYHEGSRYVINKVNLPVVDSDDGLVTATAKQCPNCGYFHPITDGVGRDLCERCNQMLPNALTSLFRLQNVSTKRRDRISSDEEERMRQGFELRTALRFQENQAGDLSAQSARLTAQDGTLLANLTYAGTATIWRINMGWRRRANPNELGFVLDVERGYWAKESDQADDPDDPTSPRTQRVIPFVEDTKNSLLFEPAAALSPAQMASLQAALKAAIQVKYQLEDNELSAEPLPDSENRKLILFYESAEGGAGVLRQLLQGNEFAEVAQTALQLCHFDPATGEDLRRAENSDEDCEAACYNCLMSYYNQMEHRLLDRQTIKDILMTLAGASVQASPSALSRAEHLRRLKNLCQSDLEREWLDFLEARNLNLPSHAQKLVESCHTRPDFLYERECVAIYVDGPHHQYPERQERDAAQQECMEDGLGYSVLRFGLTDDWEQIIARYPNTFGVHS